MGIKTKAQTKVASKLKFPAEQAKLQPRKVIKIRPYLGKEAETKISWDATQDVEGLEGFQLASVDFVKQYTNQKANEGKVQKLFIAEVNSADGSVFQMPVTETNAENVQQMQAKTKVTSKWKSPAERASVNPKKVTKIRPYMGEKKETKIIWDATEDVEGLDGYQLASSDFVKQYSSGKADQGIIQKLFVAEIKPADGTIFQIPVIEAAIDKTIKEKASTKVATKFKLPAEKVVTHQKTVINIRPYMGKEKDSEVTWDSTEEVEGIEGFQIASSEFVNQYSSKMADKGKVQKLFVA